MHRKVVFGTMLALLAAMLLVGAAAATGTTHKVDICHAVEGSHPFNLINVDKNSTAQGHDGHGDDIIPSFTYQVWEKTGTHTEYTWECPTASSSYTSHDDDKDCKMKVGGVWHYADKVQVGHVEDDYGWVTHAYSGKNLASLYGWGATGAEVLANRCVIPEKPYVQCSETVDQGWAYYNYDDHHDVGAPVWGDWVDNGDGTSTRIGVQAITRHQYHYLSDARDDNVICYSEFRDEPGTREVRESTDPIYGCMDDAAINYDPLATVDDQSCEYPPVCEDSEALNVGQEGECQYPQPSPEPEGCQSDKRIWIWDLQDSVTGQWFHLRDLGYDGTYDSPGVDQQCFYFGCDFVASRAWGHWVSECDSDYQAWYVLPRYAGGGKCTLPTGPSQ